jgi:DNA-directed RNA polymerase alpha subunit
VIETTAPINEAVTAIAEQHGRMVECAVISGEPAKAHAAVDRAFQMRTEAIGGRLEMVDDIREVASERIATILRAGGVHTIGDLCSHTRSTLVQIHQIRYRSADILDRELSKHGLGLRRDEE